MHSPTGSTLLFHINRKYLTLLEVLQLFQLSAEWVEHEYLTLLELVLSAEWVEHEYLTLLELTAEWIEHEYLTVRTVAISRVNRTDFTLLELLQQSE